MAVITVRWTTEPDGTVQSFEAKQKEIRVRLLRAA
jgi:hypothetical protein